jgi:hypothetical protein
MLKITERLLQDLLTNSYISERKHGANLVSQIFLLTPAPESRLVPSVLSKKKMESAANKSAGKERCLGKLLLAVKRKQSNF